MPVRSAMRGGWALLALGHLPALATAVLALVGEGGGAAALRVGGLLLAEVFFALKLLDIPWLRLPSSRRGLIAFWLIVALLHAHVGYRVATESLDLGTWPTMALVGGAALVLADERHDSSPPRRPATKRQRAAQRATTQQRTSRFLTADLPPRFLLYAPQCAVNRAPPAATTS